jgi:hypothetical protein
MIAAFSGLNGGWGTALASALNSVIGLVLF